MKFVANRAFSTLVANHVSKLGFEPGFETAASFCHMGLQLLFGYLVGNLRLEIRFARGGNGVSNCIFRTRTSFPQII